MAPASIYDKCILFVPAHLVLRRETLRSLRGRFLAGQEFTRHPA